MTRLSTYLIISIALASAGCEDESTTPPFVWPGGDSSVPRDGSTTPPEDSGTPVDKSCTVGAAFTLGEPEQHAMNPDRVHVISRPGTGSEFVLATAQEFCPTPPCDGNVGGDGMGSEDWRRRRALLYTFDAMSAPSAPKMVNLGLGQNQLTDARSPALAPVGDALVVAWLDPGDSDNRVDVWTQSVMLTSLEPQGTMTRASDVAESARRLVLVPGASAAAALYEDFAQGSPPSLHMVEISATGEPGSPVALGTIPESADSHAGIRLDGGALVFGRTEPLGGGDCDFLVGDPADPDSALPVQEDPATRPCADVALAPGGAAFAAIASGASVVQFRPLSPSGEPVGREVKIAGGPGKPVGQPALAKFADGFFLAYVEYGEPSRLRGALLTSAGAVQEDVELVADLGSSLANPTVAVAADGSAVAVAWKERGPTNLLETRAVRLSCD